MALRLNSHNEWDRLREVVVGSATGTKAVLTWAKPEPPAEDVLRQALAIANTAYPRWFLDEVDEDLDNLAAAITRWGAKVYRPSVHDISRIYSTPFWQSTGNSAYNVRDLHLVVGNTLIESPSYLRSRYFEAMALYDIWYEYFEHGFRWICGPRPRLDREVSEAYFRSEDARPLTPEDVRYMELTDGRVERLHRLNEREIVFEAANTLRLGRDLLFLVSSSGNYKSAKWLQSVLGDEYRVHTTEDIYRSSHIDSTALALRPGLVLLNSKRVGERNCPRLFDKWQRIYFEDVAPTSRAELEFQENVRDPAARHLEALGFWTNLGDMASPWVGMNVLSLDPGTVVVDERQTSLRRALERRGFAIVPVRMRHAYTMGGGIHCATLDTVRESTLERYVD